MTLIHSSTISPVPALRNVSNQKNAASEEGPSHPFSGHPPKPPCRPSTFMGSPSRMVLFPLPRWDVFRQSTQSSGSQDPEMPLALQAEQLNAAEQSCPSSSSFPHCATTYCQCSTNLNKLNLSLYRYESLPDALSPAPATGKHRALG